MLILFIATSLARALFWSVVLLVATCAVCAALPLGVPALAIFVCLEILALGRKPQ